MYSPLFFVRMDQSLAISLFLLSWVDTEQCYSFSSTSRCTIARRDQRSYLLLLYLQKRSFILQYFEIQRFFTPEQCNANNVTFFRYYVPNSYILYADGVIVTFV